ncbi:hypothetical protein IGI04_034862 [Brassica rapa subsp. trilocularis]|uniref:Uncharacterized protein n=1 Tax=Brassica rapa subsp. trilocularis TaxID=1813537 RepID=A0ABQ7LA03_BRACM|nr:hypothetical protein IGI04_034862 [Brassica rapa subsp. trilocularis]
MDLSFRRYGEAVVSVSLLPWCLGFGHGFNPFQDVPQRSSTSRRAAVVSSLAVSDAAESPSRNCAPFVLGFSSRFFIVSATPSCHRLLLQPSLLIHPLIFRGDACEMVGPSGGLCRSISLSVTVRLVSSYPSAWWVFDLLGKLESINGLQFKIKSRVSVLNTTSPYLRTGQRLAR